MTQHQNQNVPARNVSNRLSHWGCLRLFLIGLLVFTAPMFARAELRILFIGNSFTFGASEGSNRTEKVGGVPALFSALAQAGGQGNPEVVMRTVGGQSFKFHARDAATQTSIKSQPWDYVVLQNYSTAPTHYAHPTSGIADHFKYGLELYQQVKTNRLQTRVILYETWSRPVANKQYITGISSATNFASTTEMQTELRTNYLELANRLNAGVPAALRTLIAPVGDAWQKAGGLLPPTDPAYVNLFRSDNYHGNDNGYYLAACVFYSRIYGRTPHGLSIHTNVADLHLNLTVPPALLEDAAWDTVEKFAN